jgi:transcriptional regulator of acetoin/glycerol metabolism
METHGSPSLKEIRKEHILKVLRATQGDIDQACRILGISVGTLRRRIKELGISAEEEQDRTKT